VDDVTIGSLAGWDGCALSEVGTRDGEAVRAALWAPDRVVWDEDLALAVEVPRVRRVVVIGSGLRACAAEVLRG
jgi:hypothetical protein